MRPFGIIRLGGAPQDKMRLLPFKGSAFARSELAEA